MIYGKRGVFNAERFIDVMQAFENFISAAKSGGGENLNGNMAGLGSLQGQSGFLVPIFPSPASQPAQPVKTRAALIFLLSDKGNFFREFILDEVDFAKTNQSILLKASFRVKYMMAILMSPAVLF